MTEGESVGVHANATNGTVLHHAAHDSEPTAILFIFISCTIGALIRTCLKKVKLPYTVVLLMFGCFVGAISSHVEIVAKYTTMTDLDPHTILNIFLPILIFESAFAMEFHMFMKSFFQILILAIPGLCVTTFLTCLFGMFVFDYQWSWSLGMIFGAVASATDPVAVVALLSDLGTSKQLSTIMEGESLLNDGAAIVIFNVFLKIGNPDPDNPFGGVDILTYFLQVTLGGPLFGFFMGKITTLWLVNIFNDALTEITITLASTYVTFYVAEVFLDISGVLAVVVLGLVVSSEKTSISPEVEAFLHRFWEMLSYLANTLIFILVGVVITERAIQHSEVQDWFLLMALYCSVFAIRAMMLMLFSPLLARVGYGMSWRYAAIMTWGGLRGAVGLALALILLQYPAIDPTGNAQNKILLHTAGLVVLTLCVNATTLETLLSMLGMNEISVPKRLAMASAVRNLKEVAQTSLTSYKTDRFLADADWDIVMKYVEITDPYKTVDEEAALDDLTNFQRTSTCPQCSTHVPYEPSASEWKEMESEAKLRTLKAEKVSYWRQFEHGMLSREAVRRLMEQVDTVSNSAEGIVVIDEIKKSWEVKGFYAFLKKKVMYWKQLKPDQETIVWPENKIRRNALRITLHPAFDIVLYVIIFLNVVFVIHEVVVEATLCPQEIKNTYGNMFGILNYIFCILYVIEFLIKIIALHKKYFQDKWNIFDFIILLTSIAELIVDIALWGSGDIDQECNSNISSFSSYFNTGALKIVKSVRMLRLLRSLRLVKGLVPQVIDFLNHQLNKKLRLGYDVGKGYITAEEDVLNHIDIMIDNKKIASTFKAECNDNRRVIMKELGQLQKNHPGIAVSIKTQQAARRILNNIRDRIAKLRSEGVLDEMEGHKLEMVIEIKMKMLQKIPATIHPPPPEKIIYNLSWVAGDAFLMDYIKANAVLVTMQEGEELDVESDPHGGIYVVISGLIKVDKYVEDYSQPDSRNRKVVFSHTKDNALDFDRMGACTAVVEKESDYFSTGSVLGEWALLTGKAGSTIIRCDTSLQMYHISYEAIQSAIELFTAAPSLEYRLWRVAALRVALPIIRKQKFFRTWGSDRIKTHMEKSILVMKKWQIIDGNRLLNPFVFDLKELLMSDVVLIHGYGQHPDTGDIYQGPCYLPSHLNAIHLLPGRTEKHILIIISRDTSVQLDEEEFIPADNEDPTSALKSAIGKSPSSNRIGPNENSSMCLLHAAHLRHELEERASDLKLNKVSSESTTLLRKASSYLRQRVRREATNLQLESGMVDSSSKKNTPITVENYNNSATIGGQKVGFRPVLPPLHPPRSSKISDIPHIPIEPTAVHDDIDNGQKNQESTHLTTKPPRSPKPKSNPSPQELPPIPKRELTPVNTPEND